MQLSPDASPRRRFLSSSLALLPPLPIPSPSPPVLPGLSASPDRSMYAEGTPSFASGSQVSPLVAAQASPLLQPAPSNWDSLLQEARRVEVSLEQSINAYNSLARSYLESGPGPDPTSQPGTQYSEREKLCLPEGPIPVKIQQYLAELRRIVESMEKYQAHHMGDGGDPTGGQTTASTVAVFLRRYRESVAKYEMIYRRNLDRVLAKSKRTGLLAGTAGQPGSTAGGASSGLLVTGLNHLDQSNQQALDLLDQAHEAHEALITQREMLNRAHGRVANINSRLPRINALLKKIKRRKKRETLILGAVAGFCLFLVVLFLF
ncbi:hypothetical protein H696_05606 [Fonticula alba]|uniref:Vesicle transport v-SNARE N-terminal domain-containing protein n=1 Tax=Fonticula alba TaxID=691883 RepID=A0A058Z2Y0_FONAL|nr:hypothetical protein H696_05606 [Fonticula alba]KCV67877.1 hypothetical protein H696_05606 [Fonticula alba]|eukprot:XP_009497697.1 hypothetical protein H696_05606 [Fonticula alba]